MKGQVFAAIIIATLCISLQPAAAQRRGAAARGLGKKSGTLHFCVFVARFLRAARLFT